MLTWQSRPPLLPTNNEHPPPTKLPPTPPQPPCPPLPPPPTKTRLRFQLPLPKSRPIAHPANNIRHAVPATDEPVNYTVLIPRLGFSIRRDGPTANANYRYGTPLYLTPSISESKDPCPGETCAAWCCGADVCACGGGGEMCRLWGWVGLHCCEDDGVMRYMLVTTYHTRMT